MYEAEAREILAGKRAAVLVEIVEGGWARMVAENRKRRKRTRANIVSDYMGELADELLEPLEGVYRTETKSGMPFFVIDERMALRFKKHDKQMLVGNVQTIIQRRLATQALALDGMPPDVTFLNCGYQLDHADADIRLVLVTKPSASNKNEWYIDLRDLAEGTGADPLTAPLPIAPTSTPNLPSVVRPAEEKGEE